MDRRERRAPRRPPAPEWVDLFLTAAGMVAFLVALFIPLALTDRKADVKVLLGLLSFTSVAGARYAVRQGRKGSGSDGP